MGEVVALLGLGAMGARMGGALLAKGHELRVWNRTPGREQDLVRAGARVAGTPAQAARGAGLVLCMVRDDAASEQVWTDPAEGALAGMDVGATGIECSTLSVQWGRQLAAAVGARGRGFLEAPVVGSRPQAEAGRLVHLVGGSAALLERARPVLEATGSIVHTGPHGSGFVMKLIVNALFGVQVAALAELLALGRGLGVEPAALAGALEATPVLAPAGRAALASMLSGAFAPQFPVELVAKDFGYVRAAGDLAGTALPVSGAVAQILERAALGELRDLNLTALARLYPHG